MTKRYKYPIVEVRWDDAESMSHWQEAPTKVDKSTLMMTLGFLIVDQPDYLLVADSYEISDDSKLIGGTTKIPRGMVREMYFLNLSRQRTRKQNGQDSPAKEG